MVLHDFITPAEVGPDLQGAELGPRWPCYHQQLKPRLWFICVVLVPSVKQHCFLLTSDEKHICAQTTKVRQEFIWFLLLEIGLPLNNRKTDPNLTFLVAQRCSDTTLRYQRHNKLITKSWFKPVSLVSSAVLQNVFSGITVL